MGSNLTCHGAFGWHFVAYPLAENAKFMRILGLSMKPPVVRRLDGAVGRMTNASRSLLPTMSRDPPDWKRVVDSPSSRRRWGFGPVLISSPKGPTAFRPSSAAGFQTAALK